MMQLVIDNDVFTLYADPAELRRIASAVEKDGRVTTELDDIEGGQVVEFTIVPEGAL